MNEMIHGGNGNGIATEQSPYFYSFLVSGVRATSDTLGRAGWDR